MNIIQKSRRSSPEEIPVLISGEFVAFPGMRFPYFTTSSKTVEVIKAAFRNERLVFFAYPQESGDDSEKQGNIEIFRVGTVVKILQLTETQSGAIRFSGEAQYRATVIKTVRPSGGGVEFVRIQRHEEDPALNNDVALLMGAVRKSFHTLQNFQKKLPKEMLDRIHRAPYPDKLTDLIAPALNIQKDIKIELIQILNREERLKQLSVIIETEIAMMKLQGDIQKRVKERVEQTQKEYFLNEQLRQINKELGRDQDVSDEVEDLYTRIADRHPPEEVLLKARREADRLRKLQPMSPESGVLRTYLEWLADMPWSNRTDDQFDIHRAESILNADHYNMEKAKDRILDYIAVRGIRGNLKGPILCLVGPPGTGKTSLGRSIARSLQREFIRISLGGVRDEAEIRGHRKTYVGALPGKIVQCMKKVGTVNPVFLLDEIDKLGADFRGDPSSALLEVLDPEQNSSFTDHYLEVPYDLSQVLFIATANSLHNIPPALRDRMEIIEIPGYSDLEKYQIATRFLIPKQLKENGLDDSGITFQKPAIFSLINDYTMESGVRNLERTIGSVIRKLARILLKDSSEPGKVSSEAIAAFRKKVTPKSLVKLIGKPLFTRDLLHETSVAGVANGLAWTEMGGRMLTVEASLMPGSGNLILTGNLGEVMKESARISLSYIQSHTGEFGLDAAPLDSRDIHVHVPQGAIPKDGPSAGITITHAILSRLSNTPLVKGYAMTGEITLTGRIMPIGGVKEKVLAAYRNGICNIILPQDNSKDAQEDLPEEVKEKITIHYVRDILEALAITLPEVANGNASKKERLDT